MPDDIQQELIDKAKSCNFGKKCLKDFDNSLCCNIIEKCSNFLMVTPVSTFKSANCAYNQIITNDGDDVHVCSCPLRMELYEKYGK